MKWFVLVVFCLGCGGIAESADEIDATEDGIVAPFGNQQSGVNVDPLDIEASAETDLDHETRIIIGVDTEEWLVSPMLSCVESEEPAKKCRCMRGQAAGLWFMVHENGDMALIGDHGFGGASGDQFLCE
jgi:hypothetical protein